MTLQAQLSIAGLALDVIGVWLVAIELLVRRGRAERGLLAVCDAQREILKTMGDQRVPRRDWLTRDFQDEEHAAHYRAEAQRLDEAEAALGRREIRFRYLGWLGVSLITTGFLLQALSWAIV